MQYDTISYCMHLKAPPCFSLEDVSAMHAKNSSVSSATAGVAVTASSLTSLTYGIGWYLRFRCGITVGWPHGGGSFTTPPATWPSVGARVDMHRAVPITYIDNVCTHSYSYVWYDEDMWMQHIDWMAISGITHFLAMTGQEEVSCCDFCVAWFGGVTKL